jgi:TonB family protein
MGPAGGIGSGNTRDDVALREIQARLAKAARDCYPKQAARYALKATVSLAFCIDSSGRANQLKLAAASGVAVLDRAALDCVVPGAAPFPPRVGCYSVPVRFGD